MWLYLGFSKEEMLAKFFYIWQNQLSSIKGINCYQHKKKKNPQRTLFLQELPEESTKEQASENQNDQRGIDIRAS